MTSYKSNSVIPDPLPPEADDPHRAADSNGRAALATRTGDVGSADTAQVLWSNGDWAVTEYGLESTVRSGPQRMLINYVVEVPRLLKIQHGTPNVSMWAAQIAGKPWVPDPDAFSDAFEQALRLYYPGQNSVDIAASREVARRTWHRSRRRAEGASDSGSASEPAWLSLYPARYHEPLRTHGVPPDDRPQADGFNRRVIALAESGLVGKALDDAVRGLEDEYFVEREPEEDVHEDAEFVAEELPRKASSSGS
jgi:hypothetical protein